MAVSKRSLSSSMILRIGFCSVLALGATVSALMIMARKITVKDATDYSFAL